MRKINSAWITAGMVGVLGLGLAVVCGGNTAAVGLPPLAGTAIALLTCAFLILAISWLRWLGRLRRLEAAIHDLVTDQPAGFPSDGGDRLAGIIRAAGDLVHQREAARTEVSALRQRLLDEQKSVAACRLALDNLREARNAAERADHSKSRFLAAASHDLRQPLQALGLFVAALAQQPLSDNQRAIVGRIEGALEALEHLLDTLLDISRLDAGVVEAHSCSFHCQELFDRLALEFEPLAANKNLGMRFVATSRIARSDPALLERILRNLLSNAVRYTSKGGIVVGCRPRGDGLLIEVCDSGRGIPAEQQEEIFREFHQVGGSAGDRGRGLGLGLAIVERLAALLGHTISVRSTPGKGSVFGVRLQGGEILPHGVGQRPSERHAASTSDMNANIY